MKSLKDIEHEETFVTRRIGTETIIVPVRGGVGDLNAIYTLNQSGADTWQMIREGMSVPEIVGALCCQYNVCADSATSDIMQFTSELWAAGLIRSLPEIGI